MTTPHPMPPVPWTAPALPVHPRSTTALVLGIIGVGGFFVLLLPVLLSPLAWYYGAVAMREIDREPARWGGLGQAKAGLVVGIIGTCLLGLTLLLMLLAVMGIIAMQAYDSGYTS